MNVFVGNTYLVEIHGKKLTIFKPDSASKKEDAYERYILGQVVLQTSFNDIILNKPVSKYNITGYKQINATRTPELILKVKNKYILVNTKIQELKSI